MKKIVLSLMVCVLIISFTRYAFAQESLTCEEHLLPITVDWSERDPLKAICEFARDYEHPIYAKRKLWQQYRNDNNKGLDTYNEKLTSIGFKIVPSASACWHSSTFDLIKGDSIYVAGIELDNPFFFNDSSNQFILLANIIHPNGPCYREGIIITNNFVKPNPYHYHYLYFYKNGILLLYDEYDKQSVLFADIHNEKDTILFKYEIKAEHPDFVHKHLTVKNTDWILECEENVFVNGINIGEEKGYVKIFDYSYMNDKPFYFYEKDSLISISYNDKTLPYKYKNVLHYECCEPGMLNPSS
jgi:hypothetical protein